MKTLGLVTGIGLSLSLVLVAGAGAAIASGCSSTTTTTDTSPTGNGTGAEGGASGSNGGGDTDAGADGDPLAACPGISLAQSGTWDIDLKAAHVTGKVTLNGKTAANADAIQISFVDPKTKVSALATVDATGAYQTTLAPGTYDIYYDPSGQTCDASATWPCISHVLQTAVSITADGALDVDVPAVKATGKVTLAGAAFPGTVNIGSLAFADSTAATPSAGSVAVMTGTTATYAATLVPGHYRVSYSGGGGSCGTAAPCNGGTLKQDVALTASGVLDLDVPFVVVRGHATLNGAALPSSTSPGSVSFARPAVNGVSKESAIEVALDASGTYAAGLFPDTYDVGYVGPQSGGASSPFPRNSGTLKPGTALMQSGTLDLDIPSATVQGKVTVNGAAIPTNVSPGYIAFGPQGTAVTSGAASVQIAQGSYTAVLLAGAYDIAYASNGGGCTGTAASVVPCNGGKIKSVTLAKAQSGVLDLDVPTATLTGKVTVNKNAIAQNDSARITFAPAGSPSGEAAFSMSTTGTYTVTLLTGTYDVGFGGGGSCDPTTSGLPCNAGLVHPSVPVTTSGALDIDIPTVSIQGKVTLFGKDVPQTMDDRGSVAFAEKSGGSADTQPFSSSGPMTYTMRLLPGSYVLTYAGNASLCANGISPLPCHPVVVAGCP